MPVSSDVKEMSKVAGFRVKPGMTVSGNENIGGFTLIEMMLVMVLLAVILGAVYSSFFFSEKAINGLDESLLKLQESRNAIDRLSREIDSAFYSPVNTKCIFKIDDRDFYGKQASRLTFTSLSPLMPGVSAISYYAEQKDGALTLYKKMDSIVKPAGANANNAIEMIEGIDSFTVEALNNAKWVKTWDASATGTVPQQIRITITMSIKDSPITFYETITPKIGNQL